MRKEGGSRESRLGVACLLLVMGCMAARLGSHALIDPDEGRTAAVALAMARSGDYVLPRLDGLPHLDKPPLFHVAQAAAMRLFGATELAARLPALLSTWAIIVWTACFARHLFGHGAAWTAGIACATAPLAVVLARTAIFDSMLALFVVVALTAFYLAIESEPGARAFSHRRWWTFLAWGAMALGVLTKGPVALALPLLVAAPYALWRRRAIGVWHPAGPVLHLLVVLPWAFAVEERVPGFLHYALVTETWRRLTTGELQRGGPLWYFLPYLVVGCFPWILVATVTVVERWRRSEAAERRPLLFLVLWIAVPLLFFSLSQSKRPHYLFPLVPAFGLLAASAWGRPEDGARAARGGAIAWLLSGSAVTLAVARGIANRPHVPLELASDIRMTALALGALMMAAGALAWLVAGRPILAVTALGLPSALLPLVAQPLLVTVAESRSARDLAAELRPHLRPDTEIVGIESFSPSLTFYLGRPIHVSSSTGQPLGSNYVLRSYSTWVDKPGSTLHRAGWWHEVLGSCPEPLVFLLETRYEGERRILEAAGLPLRFRDRRLTVMGPCTREGGPHRNSDGRPRGASRHPNPRARSGRRSVGGDPLLQRGAKRGLRPR